MTLVVCPSNSKGGTKRGVYNRWGKLVKLAAELSGRAPSTVYAVLHGRIKSAPVERAIREAAAGLRQSRRKGAP